MSLRLCNVRVSPHCLTTVALTRLWCGLENGVLVLLDFESCLEVKLPEPAPLHKSKPRRKKPRPGRLLALPPPGPAQQLRRATKVAAARQSGHARHGAMHRPRR
eukprot:SAG11_NODE_517_length_8815_cov_35.866797_5_plen_104_part_00